MKAYYFAENLKNRHTSAGKLIWIMPLTAVALAAGLTGDYFTIDCYNWWYVILFTGLTAFLCGAVGNRDKKLGNRTIWTLPAKPGPYGTVKFCTASAVWGSPCWCWAV